MNLYHITDFTHLNSILKYGLLGNPIVYVTTSVTACLAIRKCQEELYEKRKDVGFVIFTFDSMDFQLLDDPHCTLVNNKPVAFMIYADIPASLLSIL